MDVRTGSPFWCRVARPWARRHSRPAHRDDLLGVVPRHPRRPVPRPSDPAAAVLKLASDASLLRYQRPPSCSASSVIVGLVRHPPCLPLLPTPRRDRLVSRSWKVAWAVFGVRSPSHVCCSTCRPSRSSSCRPLRCSRRRPRQAQGNLADSRKVRRFLAGTLAASGAGRHTSDDRQSSIRLPARVRHDHGDVPRGAELRAETSRAVRLGDLAKPCQERLAATSRVGLGHPIGTQTPVTRLQ